MRLITAEKTYLRRKKSRLKPRLILFIVLAVIIFGLFKLFSHKKEITLENKPKSESIGVNTETNERVASYKILSGEIPADIFKEQGKFSDKDVLSLLNAGENVYDFSIIKAGQTLCFYFGEEEKAKRMEYDCDDENVIMVERNGDEFNVHKEKINYEISQEIAKGRIENFFYVDAQKAGLSEASVLEVSDMFSFDIDFMTEIRLSDEFTVVYEKRKRDGEPAPDGKVLAAKFINEGKVVYAYYFESDGKEGYYDPDGKLLERQFLRAPLSYRRITSGFTGVRLHPITKQFTTHYQIDYAAPIGTPVISTANGTIASAGWEGGWGNMVRIRHDNGYTTHYGHLSGFAKGVRSGTHVSRGQLIGFVGSTGWSTGPHLDYGIRLNGAPVNPLKMDLPKGPPLSEDKMPEFEEIKNKYASQLE